MRTAPTLLTSTSSRPCSSTASPTHCAAPSGAASSPAPGATPWGRGAGHDARALSRERPGDGKADPLARSGDDGYLAVQIQVHGVLVAATALWSGARR